MNNLKSMLDALIETFWYELKAAKTETDLESVRLKYLSRNGLLTEIMVQLKNLPTDEKKVVGPLANSFKTEALEAFTTKQQELIHAVQEKELQKKAHFDVTAYNRVPRGTLHPYTIITQKIEEIFTSMGYVIADGPEVETPFYNFEALNIPPDHPARDMHDTFWLSAPGYLLRTHTSTIQVHAMQQTRPPLAICAPGRTYRHEATDATHDFVFTQCEGLVIDKNISIADLLGTVKVFLQALFERQTIEVRARPSYFPFVEPGLEIDIACLFCTSGCSVCKKTGWIELSGAGLVHPHVLKACGIDPNEWSGFAFGMGLERLAMLKYHIRDIRLFKSSKIEFLNQFS